MNHTCESARRVLSGASQMLLAASVYGTDAQVRKWGERVGDALVRYKDCARLAQLRQSEQEVDET